MVDQSLAVVWSRPLRLRSSAATVAATSEVLLVAERHSRLVRLDPRSGAILWEQRVEDCWGTTVIAEECCLYLSQLGVLHCLDLQNGHRMWSTPGLQFHRYLSVSGTVVLLGGWRGYHPLTRVDLAAGRPDPFNSPYAPGEPLAWPVPIKLKPSPHTAVAAVLLASASRPELRLIASRTEVDLGMWQLPAPVQFPDSGNAYSRSDDGRVVFVSGRRNVMAFGPSAGVEMLWEHARNLPPLAPVLSNGMLMLAEDACITVVDLINGGLTEITSQPPGVACAPVPVAGGALFARSDGNVVMIDRTGTVRASARLPTRMEQLVTAGSSLAHTIGKGHLTTLSILSMEH
ncbi:outer membrane protein assembly factor BamB family protein [Dactylosporangium matsuzakiense]|uniref:Pyrrolo-quinoline quinone repeat domain-containing protein n=1 Tax=Dactylosporangium matsuzakiense TaxID=53360 RepID=A0A9W6KUN0_9ACTN|nr:PQQ-binding-like beta-propeller repeat protein [Dactylosporangium matsuzakiense]GLL07537.1 hypothetical protein GCM10017581_092910 [Dactylosporangium matsuzakiense]